MGISEQHSSTVPLVLSTATGSITPQFHVVFDDWFATVSAEQEDIPDFSSKEWNKMFGDSVYQYVTDETEAEDLTNEEDLIETLKSSLKSDKINQSLDQHSTNKKVTFDDPPELESPGPNTDIETISEVENTKYSTNQSEEATSTPKTDPAQPSLTKTIKTSRPNITKATSPKQPKLTPRKTRSQSSNLRPRNSKRVSAPAERLTYTHDKSSLTREPSSFTLAYDHINEDYTHVQSYRSNSFAYVSSKKEDNPDLFSYDQAMNSEHRNEWINAAAKEIKQLEDLDCWDEIPLEKAKSKVLPGTWVFKVKRAPDGSFKKFKARYCIRGDLQEGDFDTFAPVVQFSSVRILLVWSLLLNWTTCSIDFSNAFIQAELKDDVYIHLPRGFRTTTSNSRTCLKLKKSIYGLSVAPRLWYQHLWSALESLGLKKSKHDSCLMMRKDLLVICYVDDLGVQAPNKQIIDDLIKNLKEKGFGLTLEGTFSEYLGIKYQKDKDSIKMTQQGLIQKIITATGMTECNPNKTPTTKESLATDEDGEPMDDPWNYRSIVGMMLYLSTNTRPDIAYAVSQVARFSHNPKKSHATAVKMIVRYLSGTIDQGIIFKQPNHLHLDCYVDADFAGLYGREKPDNPASVKSRTGYIISFGGCFILCKSQLQPTIALSTSEAEYGALSSSMRSIIPIREILLEIIDVVNLTSSDGSYPYGNKHKVQRFKTTVYEDNSAALGLAINQKLTSRTKHWAVKFHFFWNYVNDPLRYTSVVKVETKLQKADYLTKGLTKDNFERCRHLNQGW